MRQEPAPATWAPVMTEVNRWCDGGTELEARSLKKAWKRLHLLEVGKKQRNDKFDH